MATTDSHKHQCERCGCVWAHPDDRCDHAPSHRCPLCGEMRWKRYKGQQAPQFIDPLTEEGRDARSLRKEKQP